MATTVDVSPYSPANGAQNQPTALTLSWDKTNLQTSTVRVLFSTTYVHVLNFYSAAIVSDTATTTHNVSGLTKGTTYYWRAWSAAGGPNYASAVFSFTVIPDPPSKATTPNPSSGSTGVALDKILTWANGGGATGYDVWFGESPGSLAKLSSNQSSTSYTPSLSANTQYYWRIDAVNAGGTQVTTGDVWNFTTVNPQPPDTADIVSPADDATDISRSTSLEWKDGTDSDPAASYDIYFGTDSTLVTNATTASDQFKTNQSHSGDRDATQSYNPASLGNNTDYYWRIDAVNTEGTTKGDTWYFKTIAVSLGTPVDKVYKKKLTALADDKFWYEDDSHDLISLGSLEIETGDGLDLTKPVSMLAAYQKIFIVNGANKKVIDFSNSRLTVSAISHIPQRGAILTQTGGAAMVIDFIDTDNEYIYGFVTNGTFATGTASITEDGTGYDYTVTAVTNVSATPLYYNWVVYPDNDDTADEKVNGKMPAEPSILTLFRGKIVMSGDKNSPQIIYMSENGDPFNFSYSEDSAISAAAVSGGFVGNIGDIVTACVPYKDDYMLAGCSQTIWLFRGDPAEGGSIDQISFTVGMFDKSSFTWDSQENLYFIDTNGIYKIPAGFGAVENLTQNTIPDFTSELPLTADVHRITMAYDRTNAGLVICKTDTDSGANENFWFDLRTGGFFKEKYPADCSIYSGTFYGAEDVSYRKMLLGCRDGYIRAFDSALYKDQSSSDYEAIDSFVLLGPGRICSDDMAGLLVQMIFTLAEDSNLFDYELYTAKTAQEAVERALDINGQADYTGSVDAGISYTIRPRVRGCYLVVKIKDDSLDKSWAVETITAQIKNAGVVR